MQLAKLRQGEGKAARDPTSKHHFQYYEEEEEEEDGGVTKCNFSNATLDFKLVRSDTFFRSLINPINTVNPVNLVNTGYTENTGNTAKKLNTVKFLH